MNGTVRKLIEIHKNTPTNELLAMWRNDSMEWEKEAITAFEEILKERGVTLDKAREQFLNPIEDDNQYEVEFVSGGSHSLAPVKGEEQIQGEKKQYEEAEEERQKLEAEKRKQEEERQKLEAEKRKQEEERLRLKQEQRKREEKKKNREAYETTTKELSAHSQGGGDYIGLKSSLRTQSEKLFSRTAVKPVHEWQQEEADLIRLLLDYPKRKECLSIAGDSSGESKLILAELKKLNTLMENLLSAQKTTTKASVMGAMATVLGAHAVGNVIGDKVDEITDELTD